MSYSRHNRLYSLINHKQYPTIAAMACGLFPALQEVSIAGSESYPDRDWESEAKSTTRQMPRSVLLNMSSQA